VTLAGHHDRHVPAPPGEVVYPGAAGLGSLEQRTPLPPPAILDVGSVPKQFTAFAVVLLSRPSLDDGTVWNGRNRGVRFDIMP
jgi:hypothetical protein